MRPCREHVDRTTARRDDTQKNPERISANQEALDVETESVRFNTLHFVCQVCLCFLIINLLGSKTLLIVPALLVCRLNFLGSMHLLLTPSFVVRDDRGGRILNLPVVKTSSKCSLSTWFDSLSYNNNSSRPKVALESAIQVGRHSSLVYATSIRRRLSTHNSILPYSSCA
jgi:hypothetical protein